MKRYSNYNTTKKQNDNTSSNPSTSSSHPDPKENIYVYMLAAVWANFDGQNLDCLFCSCSSSICAVSARQSHNHTEKQNCNILYNIYHTRSFPTRRYFSRSTLRFLRATNPGPRNADSQHVLQNQTLCILSFQIWHHNPWRQTCALNSNFRFHPLYMFPDLSDQWICGQNVKSYEMGIGMNLWPFCFLHLLLTSAFTAHQPCTNLFEFQLKRKS